MRVLGRKYISKLLTPRLLVVFIVLIISSSQAVLAQDIVYLPLIGGGLATTGMIDRPATDFESGIPSPQAPNIDYWAIPECTQEQLDALNKLEWGKLPSPNNDAQDGCVLPRGGAHPLAEWNMQSDVSAANLFWPIKYAVNNLNCVAACSSTDGVVSMHGFFSAKEPSLAAGKSWNDFFYGNFMRVSDRSNNITCQGGFVSGPSLYVGIGKGNTTADNVFLPTPTLYWEEIRSGYCYGFTTYLTIAPTAAPYIEIYKDADNGANSSFWTARIWTGNWTYIFTHVAMPWGYSADTIVSGQMIHAKNSDWTSMSVPMNFVHKLELQKYGSGQPRISWHNASLPSPLNGKTTVIADNVFNVMDIVGNDYTSIASER